MSSQSNFWEGGPRTLFYTGLFLGVASTLAVFFAFTFTSGLSLNTLAASNDNANLPSPAPSPSPSPTPVAGPVKAVDEKTDHIRGSKNAKVTLVEYSDFECPFCSRHLPAINQALSDFPNDVRLVYRHYPLTQIHQNAQKAAEAAECANKVGGVDKFWQMHDKLFTSQGAGFSVALFKQLAGQLGLKQVEFDKCLDSGEMANRVAADLASGNDAGVAGTPATFVNGVLVEGAVPYSELQAAIQQALAK